MAHTVIKICSGNNVVPSGEVRFDPEFSGEHHELLLASTPTMFERNLTAVISSMLDGVHGDDLPYPDVLYLFFLARSFTLGPEFKSKYRCQNLVTTKSKGKYGNDREDSVKCDHENPLVFDISKRLPKIASSDFKFTTRTLALGDSTIKVQVRFLPTKEELDITDDFLTEGVTREDMTTDNKLKYLWQKERIARSLVLVNDEGEILPGNATWSHDQRREVFSGSYLAVTHLFKDMAVLDSFGMDLSPEICVCEKCGKEAKVAIPISGNFLIPNES